MDQPSKLAPVHALTLTPFFPTANDDANGCFVAEPLAALVEIGVQNSVLVAEPFYRTRQQPNSSAPAASFVRYFSIPRGVGLASAGAFLFARILGQVRELHRRQKIEVIHAHAPLPCGHAARLLSRELGIPYVVTVHGLDAYSRNQVPGIAGDWCARVSGGVYRSASRTLCISERVRERVLEGGRGLATTIVYNGVSPEVFAPAVPAEPTSPMVLSIGNLIPIKGHDVLIRAMAVAASNFPNLRLKIVGAGPERARLGSLAAELGVADRVDFLGRVPRREVACLLQNCTLFALPSSYEGLGCVYLEAMACGKSAIGCHGQGIEDVIRHGSNGWLVSPGSVEELAAALTMLLGNDMLREYIGGQARQTILHGFTLRDQAEALLRVYQECRR